MRWRCSGLATRRTNSSPRSSPTTARTSRICRGCRCGKSCAAARAPPRPEPAANGMTVLARLVEASLQVAATSSRLAKVRVLAECLRDLPPEEFELAVTYLSGEVHQGR